MYNSAIQKILRLFLLSKAVQNVNISSLSLSLSVPIHPLLYIIL